MVKLEDILDVELLNEHILNGMVTRRIHDTLPLAILNYTPECQFSRGWDDVTRKCRGLIYDYESNEVIARPFEKFGNWDESGYPYPPSGPALRMEKMDGSLGILYVPIKTIQVPGGVDVVTRPPAIATRGSFHSEQAAFATDFYRERTAQMEYDFNEWLDRGEPEVDPEPFFFFPLMGKTYLFEIIYPENRIVVDYGEYRGLVLIDVIDNETGFSDTDEFDDCEWPEKVTRQPVPGFDSGHVVDIPQGGEGFVFLWPTRNFRTKMKSAEYIELHKLVSNLSEKTVWEALVAGKTMDDIKIGLPEEFHKFIDDTAAEIHTNAMNILIEVNSREKTYASKLKYNEGLEEPTRKDWALAIKDDPFRKYLFLRLDNKSVYEVALRDSKPVKESNLTREE